MGKNTFNKIDLWFWVMVMLLSLVLLCFIFGGK